MPDQGFRFDPRTGRYHAPNGRFVLDSAVRAQVDQVLNAAASSIQGITEDLRAGRVSVQEWRSSVEASIKTSHVAAGVAARGGFAQASQADLGFIGQRIRTQYEFLDRFAAQIASGAQPLNGTLTARADLYAQAGRSTHREMQRRMGRIGGADQERNQLGSADHCEGCLDATSRGWVDIGTLPAVGSRQCLSRCHCVIQTRTTPASDQVVAA